VIPTIKGKQEALQEEAHQEEALQDVLGEGAAQASWEDAADARLKGAGQVFYDDVTQAPREGAVPPLLPWQRRGRNANYSWHPALNGIEDVLVAQVTDPSTIIDIIERVGMNPGIIQRGDGSPATLWHGALRSAWIAGHEKKVCELLCQANARQESSELQLLIETYCI
jgi:hypothetical protein